MKKVVIIDESLEMLKAIEIAASGNLDVYTMPSIDEGYELLKELPCALVLVSKNLWNRFDSELRAEWENRFKASQIPIHFIFEESGDIEEVTKPINPVGLIKYLSNLLNNR